MNLVFVIAFECGIVKKFEAKETYVRRRHTYDLLPSQWELSPCSYRQLHWRVEHTPIKLSCPFNIYTRNNDLVAYIFKL